MPRPPLETHPRPRRAPLLLETPELVLGTPLAPEYRPPVTVTRHEMFVGVVGAAGSGKSSMALTLNQQLMRHPDKPTLIVVDPDKDLVLNLLASLPPDRHEDLVLLDFGSAFQAAPAMGFFVRPAYVSPDAFADTLFELFRLKFQDVWQVAARMADILWALTQTLIVQPRASMLDGSRLLIDPVFRRQATARVTHRATLEFWREFEDWPKPDRLRLIGPVTARLRQFYRSPAVEQILDAPTTINFLDLFQGHKIVLVNLYGEHIKSDVGTLGDLFLSQLQLAFLARLSAPASERTPVFLTLDESQLFQTPSLPRMLSRGRKQGLNAVLLTQYLSGWDKELVTALHGNIGTWVTFRVGVDDSAILARYHGAEFPAHALQSLPRFVAVARPMAHGTPQPSVQLAVRPEYPANLDVASLLTPPPSPAPPVPPPVAQPDQYEDDA